VVGRHVEQVGLGRVGRRLLVLGTERRRADALRVDRNGFGYTLDRATGELLVAEKYDPAVNWATKVDQDKSSSR
jgi:glucose dehydrogenase